MRSIAVLLLAVLTLVGEAAESEPSIQVPTWACSLAAAPQREAVPSGSASTDDAAAKAEQADAQSATSDAAKLKAAAKVENKTNAKVAAEDEADASHLLTDAARENQQVQTLAAAVKKEQAQKVQEVNSASLSKLLDEKKELLVVFYAPWCGHCKTFVLGDASGNPEKAPLELLNKDFEAAKGPQIVKFNVDAGGAVPAGFEVQYIPTMFAVSSNGELKKFEGNPNDFAAVKSFAGVKAAASLFQARTKLHASFLGTF